MASASLAEIKERLSKLHVAPYPKTPTTSASNNESSPLSSSLESHTPEISKSDSSNPPSENTNQTRTDSNTSSSPTFNETSSTRDAILARYRQPGTNNTSGFRKPPVPLPQTANQTQNETPSARDIIAAHFRQQGADNTSGFRKPPVPLPHSSGQPRKESISSESSSAPQDIPTNRALTPDVNAATSLRKSPIPLPSSDQIENTYSELSNDLPNSTTSASPIDNQNFYEGFNRPSVSLPNPVTTDRPDTVHSESSSVSLDTMLPSQCMFLDFERIIHDYQRRDSRNIIYPKIKPTMPKITTEEINTLQKYVNT